MDNTLAPIGLRPKYVADSARAIEILDAIHRYVDCGLAIPDEWLDELRERLMLRSAYDPRPQAAQDPKV
jgi:hypothetical protein